MKFVYYPKFDKKVHRLVKVNDNTYTIKVNDGNRNIIVSLNSKGENEQGRRIVFNANVDNYNALCTLYETKDFEKPPTTYSNKELVNQMFDAGFKFVNVLLSNSTKDIKFNNADTIGMLNTKIEIDDNEDDDIIKPYTIKVMDETFTYVRPFDAITGKYIIGIKDGELVTSDE